mmetsp:Transcript_2141/g.4929  ORF Transcript_2141/g.4929 Transcript_2141/m.4929 type:complete len:378 (-) Transcript_2141:70-1203(-)
MRPIQVGVHLRVAPGSSERDSLLWGELRAKLRELLVRCGVSLEEFLLVLGEELEGLVELGILMESSICREPQEVFVLRRDLVVLVVAVVEGEPVLGPGAATGHADTLAVVMSGNAVILRVLGGIRVAERAGAAPVLEGTAYGVRSGQGDNILIGEAHLLTEDVAQVRCRILGTTAEGRHRVWQPSVGFEALTRVARNAGLRPRHIHAAVLHVDLRPTHALDGGCRSHLNEIGPGDSGVLVLELLQVGTSLRQASVSTEAHLRLMDDGAVGASALRPALDALIEGARVVPRNADQDRARVVLVDKSLQVLMKGLQGSMDQVSVAVHVRAAAGEEHTVVILVNVRLMLGPGLVGDRLGIAPRPQAVIAMNQARHGCHPR